jgi:serine/threonine protein phosphatase PrpC
VLNLGRLEAGRPPRTTLTFALARPQEDLLAVASVGDSHLFRVSAGSVTELAEATAPTSYLGGRSRDATLDPHVQVATLPLAGTRVLIAVTDGLSEVGIGVNDPEAAVADAVERAAKAPAPLRAREASRHVLEAALEAQRGNGSGDNVAVAAAWLGD